LPDSPLWKVDFHMHSRYSHDSSTGLEELAARARELGLNRIALTDHNTAEGALALRELEPELVIAGEEVKTTEGEVIGLFVSRTIKAWQRPEAVMDEIHEMGGLVYVPHPFDVIEGYNQWADTAANQAATEIARDLAKPVAYGSDAHSLGELGHSWIEVEPFAGPAELLERLSWATGHRTEVSGTKRRA
jgi:predicted metal-dependent phosphoesterase TrpH